MQAKQGSLRETKEKSTNANIAKGLRVCEAQRKEIDLIVSSSSLKALSFLIFYL